jgi:hypothetical protein
MRHARRVGPQRDRRAQQENAAIELDPLDEGRGETNILEGSLFHFFNAPRFRKLI